MSRTGNVVQNFLRKSKEDLMELGESSCLYLKYNDIINMTYVMLFIEEKRVSYAGEEPIISTAFFSRCVR